MEKGDKQGWVIICAVVGILILLGMLALITSASQKKYDPNTLCPLKDDYPVVRILIDKTDKWNEEESVGLKKIIKEIKDNLSISERLSISVLDATGSEVPTPIFNMCNPGRKDQINPLYKNPRRMHKKFETLFNQPLEKMLVDLLKPGIAPKSPLLEAINNFLVTGNSDRLVRVHYRFVKITIIA